ncbi:hypothetical protein FB45DRAFT_437139 [Roridomyces roridus]|uniref:Uncharacterized protein n=1 Tax=Roridomyces roridus TaxID=1738132 RepID=A0AAD7B0R3_9AGAR|nr:hypothetical protein FB45DRAFT_437139 [Roridomyces roridus]
MKTHAEKKLYENMVKEGAFVGFTAARLEKMMKSTRNSSWEMNLVGAKKTRDVLEILRRAFLRWSQIAEAIELSVDVHRDLREMADEMIYYSRKLNDIHERRSNIRRVRGWFRSYAPSIVAATSCVCLLALVFCRWEDLEESGMYHVASSLIPLAARVSYIDPHDASRISDFENTLPLLADALQGLGETYHRLGIAANVRARDPVAINKILKAPGHASLHNLSLFSLWL